MYPPSSRLAAALLLLLVSLFQTGCSMCCGTYDYAYASQGGKWQRSDMENGRVGSLFSDPYQDAIPGELDPLRELDDEDIELIEPAKRR